MKNALLLFFLIVFCTTLSAQKDTTFCTFLAAGQSPTKLLFVGYDFVAPNTITGNDFLVQENPQKVKFNGGLRIGGNLPVVNKKRWSLNIGYGFKRSAYDIDVTYPVGTYSSGLYRHMNQRGLNSTMLNTSLFIPLNNRHFVLGFAQGEISGDYNFSRFWNKFNTVRGSYSVVFGWHKRPNQTIGFGVARTWRGGTAFWNPVFLWNQTFNKHWGIELLLPARGFVRYNFSPRSLLLCGYELEGTSYNIGYYYGTWNPVYKDNFEYRRSELRTRITWEKQIYKFVWFSAQAGVRINYRNALAWDNNQPHGQYVLKNKVPPAFYALVTINLVVPPK